MPAPPVVALRRDFLARNLNDGGVPETVDDGSWLMDWLDGDVRASLARGDVHSSASTALTLTAAPGRHPSIVLTSASVCCFLRAVTASLMLLNRRPPGE